MPQTQPFVILIDDDTDDLELMSSSLERDGIKIKTFNSGVKALFYLSLLSSDLVLPSLIIMDYNMPKSNGEQILLLLKTRNDLKNIPVIMYSTFFSEVHKNKLHALGALDCFIKPWTFSDFTQQVDTFKDLANTMTHKNIPIG